MRRPFLSPGVVALLTACGFAQAAESGRLPLTLQDADPAAATALVAASPTVTPSAPADLIVVGVVRDRAFALAEPGHLRVVDAAGAPVPCWVEASSLLREFGEIYSARIAFALSPAAAAAGAPAVEWGPALAGGATVVEQLAVAESDVPRIRFFTPGAAAAGAADDTQFATVEIIADSQADKYYLWYLVPLAALTVLLVARKRALK